MTPKKRKQTKSRVSSRRFIEHIEELKSRLFIVAIAFVLASGIAYACFPFIENLLITPLGNQKLYYLTPAGGLGFIIKTCMYAGLIGVLPVAVYQLYRFVMPAFESQRPRVVLLTLSSTFLAAIGLAFGYFVSLPAALNFLTTIDLGGVSPLLTIDAYVSFVMAYLVAGALLFQLPLFLIIANSVTPLPPRKLMSSQGHVVIGSFIMAAIVSPTPDVVNQTILAAPMIVMYQLGIVMILFINYRQKMRKARIRLPEAVIHTNVPMPNRTQRSEEVSPPNLPAKPVITVRRTQLRPTIDGISRVPSQRVMS